jgi:hypothetical protein
MSTRGLYIGLAERLWCSRSLHGSVSSSLAALAKDFKVGAITIEQPWSRVGAKVASGYFTIKNDGGSPDRLTCESALLASAEPRPANITANAARAIEVAPAIVWHTPPRSRPHCLRDAFIDETVTSGSG